MAVKLELSPRLALCAHFVRKGSLLCDVGTDHAYLPIHLALHKSIQAALACDVRQGPLRCAQQHICRWQVQDTVQTRLSDGLQAVRQAEAQDIVLAGMGGDLILRIVRETPWLLQPDKRLILQPMTKPAVLRAGLFALGMRIQKEEAVFDAGHAYTVLCCCYQPDAAPPPDWLAYVGLLQGDGAAARAFLRQQARYFSGCLQGCRGQDSQAQAMMLRQALQIIQERLKEGADAACVSVKS